jgi:6-phosphogluconolactonase
MKLPRRALKAALWPISPRIILGLAALLLAGCGGSSPAAQTAAAAPFVYVADKDNSVSQFGGPADRGGALTPLAPATVPAGSFPNWITVSPQGNSVYVADGGTNSAPVAEVWQYSVNPVTGQLSPKSPATVSAAGEFFAIAVAPDGRSAYVTNVATQAVSQYSVSPVTGDLIPMTPATVAVAGDPQLVTVGPGSRYVYVVTLPSEGTFARRGAGSSKHSGVSGVGQVWQFAIIPGTGALNPTPVAVLTTGPSDQAMRISPDGRSLYIAATPGTVSQYSINPTTGKLTPKSPATIAVNSPHDLAISPDGKNAYIVSVQDSILSQYRINPRTGTLSSRPVSTAPTVLHPQSISLAPDGKSAYVSSENDGQVSQYTINPATGRLQAMSPADVPLGSGGGALSQAAAPEADISASLTAPASVADGAELDYTINVKDHGPSDAWQVILTDALPAGTRLLRARTSAGSCTTPDAGAAGGTVSCRLGEISTGAVQRVQIQVTAPTSASSITNSVHIASVTADPLPSSNACTATTRVTGSP